MKTTEASSCHRTPASESNAVLGLAVNPEARLYATVVRHEPLVASCAGVVDISVDIENSGYVTANVVPVVLAPADGRVTVEWLGGPLSGVPAERRWIRMTCPAESVVTDVTLSFVLVREQPDLGGRDRVHLLVRGHGAAKAAA